MLIPHEHRNLRQLGAAWAAWREEFSLGREVCTQIICQTGGKFLSQCSEKWEISGTAGRQRGGKRNFQKSWGSWHCPGERGQGAWHGRVRDNHGAPAPLAPAGSHYPLLSAGCELFLKKSWSGSALIICGAEGMGHSPLQQELESVHLSKNIS